MLFEEGAANPELFAAVVGGVVGSLVGSVTGGLVSLWLGSRDRRLQRIVGALTAYRELIERRRVARAQVDRAISFLGDPSDPAKFLAGLHVDKPEYAAEVARLPDALRDFESALLAVIVADSPGLRLRWAKTLMLTFRELHEDLRDRTFHKLNQHLAEEQAAADGVAAGADYLNTLLPKVPLSPEPKQARPKR
jgi:hypothetical protein